MTQAFRPAQPTTLPTAGAELVAAKILVVDDDARNLVAAAEALRSPGLEIVTAQSGEAALRRLLSDDFAVILLDVRMPRIDGYELAGLIRGRARSSRVPIIFLTAYNKDDLHVFRGYSAGAVDFVFKPIEPLILKSKVDVFVDLYRKTEEIRRQAEEERRLLMENLRVRGEKLAADEALRQRDEQQSLVLASLPIALYTADGASERREMRFTSDCIARITGYAPQDFLGDPDLFASRLGRTDRDRVLADLAVIAAKGGGAVEYRFTCADGSERYILDQMVLMRDEAGRPREFVGLWFDVSERKEMQESLLHASKLEAVGRLTGGIAHDFNNMLSVVIGNLDLLAKAIAGDERAERRAAMALEGAQRCADLTHRLLAFSRRQPLQATTIDVGAVMPGVFELLRRTLGERIAARLDMAPDVWPVKVDRAQLEAALLNLAVNARDAMPDGGELSIAVDNRSVAAGAARAAGDYVVIAVADTGIGMGPDVRARVFEPFFTTKESGKGTGLGLSMVYGFVQQSHGDVEIDSAVDAGTTIRLFLPRGEEQPVDRDDKPAAAAAPFGDGQAVLVVEDDPDVRQVAVATLRSLGFAVSEATTGDEAANLLRRDGAVDLVLSDVRMPGEMSGIELARLIRREMPRVRVLLTTGYVEDDGSATEVDVLYKPYRASDLAERIQTLLQG